MLMILREACIKSRMWNRLMFLRLIALCKLMRLILKLGVFMQIMAFSPALLLFSNFMYLCRVAHTLIRVSFQ